MNLRLPLCRAIIKAKSSEGNLKPKGCNGGSTEAKLDIKSICEEYLRFIDQIKMFGKQTLWNQHSELNKYRRYIGRKSSIKSEDTSGVNPI